LLGLEIRLSLEEIETVVEFELVDNFVLEEVVVFVVGIGRFDLEVAVDVVVVEVVIDIVVVVVVVIDIVIVVVIVIDIVVVIVIDIVVEVVVVIDIVVVVEVVVEFVVALESRVAVVVVVGWGMYLIQ